MWEKLLKILIIPKRIIPLLEIKNLPFDYLKNRTYSKKHNINCLLV